MVERNLYLVDFEIIRQRYNHIGIYGKGRDIILDITCIIHILQDKFIYPGQKQGNLVSMQVFQGLSNELLQRKLDQLVKAAYLFYVPWYQSILMVSYKKNEDKTFDLMILYDFTDLIPLEEVIKEKKINNQKFTEEEIWEIIYILIDSMYMGSRLNYEYTDISPINLFIKQTETEQSYIISNFGLQLPRKFDRPVSCPSDQFYINKIIGNQRVMDLYLKSYIFQIGMVVLYLLSFEEPNTLYQDQDQKKINQNLLQKRIDQIQEMGTSNQLLQFLNQTLQIHEDERVNIEDFMNEDASQLLPRNIVYYQGKLADAQSFSGFVEVKGEERIPHGVGDILTNEGQYYKGMFSHGSINGNGIWHDGKSKYAFGKWQEDTLKEGMLINKNDYIFYGSISDFEPAAVGVLINVAANLNAQYFYFEGMFNEMHLPQEGVTYMKNGKLIQEIPPKMQQQLQQDEKSLLQQQEQQKQQNQKNDGSFQQQSIDLSEQK